MTDKMPDENQACCAHKTVKNFNDEKGGMVTREWWACDLCGAEFVRADRLTPNAQLTNSSHVSGPSPADKAEALKDFNEHIEPQIYTSSKRRVAAIETIKRALQADAELQDVDAWLSDVPGETRNQKLTWLFEDRQKLMKAAKPDAGLVEAAKAVIERWDTPAWKDVEPTAAVINRLRAALAKRERGEE